MEGIDAADRWQRMGKGEWRVDGKESKAEREIKAVTVFK